MKTELDQLRTALRQYSNPASTTEFNKAEKVLNKFYNRYGTVDPGLVRSLIN